MERRSEPVLDFGFAARAVGGELRLDGAEGPAAVYPLDDMAALIPIRVANQRVLDLYIANRP